MAGNLHVVPPYWFIARLDTILLRHRIKKISGFTRPQVIGFVADLFFSTLVSGFKNIRIRCRIRRMRVDGSRIRKEKVADSEISGYVWTGPKNGSHKLTSQEKYQPDDHTASTVNDKRFVIQATHLKRFSSHSFSYSNARVS